MITPDEETAFENEKLIVKNGKEYKEPNKLNNISQIKVLQTLATIIVVTALFTIIIRTNNLVEKYDPNSTAGQKLMINGPYSFNEQTIIEKFTLVANSTFHDPIVYKYDETERKTPLMCSNVLNITISDTDSGFAVNTLHSSHETCKVTKDVTIYAYKPADAHNKNININIFRDGLNIGELINQNISNLNDPQIFYILNNYGGIKLRKGDILQLHCNQQSISVTNVLTKVHKCHQYIMYYPPVRQFKMCESIIISTPQLENGHYVANQLSAQNTINLPQPNSLGQVPGVAVSINGNEIYVLSRRENKYNSRKLIKSDTIFVLDATTGNIKKQFGKNLLITPHGLACDHYGNLWVTDTSLQQIFRINPTNGKVILILGIAKKTGWTSNLFNRPTDVVVDPKRDEVYISDGYGNCRVAVFSYNGTYLREWGSHIRGNKIGQFNIVHNVAMDILRDQIFVADRQNCRIQIFDRFGNILQVWNANDLYCKVPLPQVDSWRGHLSSVAYSAYLDLIITIEGAYVVGRNPKNGNEIFSFGNVSVFDWPHDVDIALNERIPSIYVAELNANRMQRFQNLHTELYL